MKLYNLFMTKDIVLLEINPLTEAADGKIYCRFLFCLNKNIEFMYM
jgi:succinyl-CoA synthetase beta subunit